MMPLLLVFFTACSNLDTDCEAISVGLTGDIGSDLLGTWDGFGIDSRILYVFDDNNDWRWVEPPNSYAPDGLEASGSWELVGETEVELTQNGISWSVWVEVGEGTLLTCFGDPAAMDTGEPTASEWIRSECSGYGF